MISPQLLQGAGSANPTMDAFDARTNQIQQQQDKESAALQADQDRKNNVFKQALSYAGDGYFNEAKYFAQQNGIDVPDEMLQNSAFSKGMANAMELYDDDPEAAMRYAQGFSSAQGDLMTRHAAGFAAGGKPRNKDDREIALYERKKQLDARYKPAGAEGNGFSLSAGQTRFDNNGNIIAQGPAETNSDRVKYVQDVVSSAVNGAMGQPIDTNKVAEEAAAQYDRLFGSGAGGASPSLMNSGIQPQGAPQQQGADPGAVRQGIYAVQQLRMQGLNAQQIRDGLVQRGATPERAQSLINAAGIQ